MRQNEPELRALFVKIGRLMYEKGFICASDGNISARLGTDRLLITPSGLHKGLLEPEHMLVVDMDGKVVRGQYGRSAPLKPTSELPMHLEAYRQRPDIHAVVHAHPPITVSLSIASSPMAALVTMSSLRRGLRSASVPPHSEKSRYGRNCSPVVMPRATPEEPDRSSTSQSCATRCIQVPAFDRTCPPK